MGTRTFFTAAAERVAGFSLATAAIVSMLHGPVLALVGRLVRATPGRVLVGLVVAVAMFIVHMVVPG